MGIVAERIIKALALIISLKIGANYFEASLTEVLVATSFIAPIVFFREFMGVVLKNDFEANLSQRFDRVEIKKEKE